MQKLNSMPSYTARFPKESHDMSQSIAFTLATGMEVPVYYDVVHPGDNYHFTCKLFARLNPLIKPAMADIDFHLDYFFVPLQVLYTPASSLQWDTDDLLSSLIDKSQLKEKLPILNINKTLDDLLANQGQSAWQSQASVFYPSSQFECKGKAYYRLLDMLGYNPDGVICDWSQTNLQADQMNPSVFPDKLAAYHAIHELYEGFRDSDREPKSYCYQLDKHYNQSDFTDYKLFELRYSYSYKDYFTAVKVSPIASSVSLLSLKDESGNAVSPAQYLRRIDNYLFTQNVYPVYASGSYATTYNLNENVTQVGTQGSNGGNQSGTFPFITTGAVRSMFAVEKLLRVIGRTEKNYESQVLAHFGFKTPHDPFHNITHIGHDMATMRPSSVVSQADTFKDNGDGTGSGAALGEIGGQGVLAFSGQKKNFTAPCHGVLMVILRAIPRYRYIGTFDKQNSIVDRMSYVQPQYMNLGMQPLFGYEAFPEFTYSGHNVIGNYGSQRAGWQYNKEQYKRKYDRASRAFFIPYRTDKVNQYSPWVLSRAPWGLNGLRSFNATPLAYYELCSTPHDLDNIMLVNFNTSWNSAYTASPWLMYQFDPFICDFNCHCKKVNIMPEYGEPEL